MAYIKPRDEPPSKARMRPARGLKGMIYRSWWVVSFCAVCCLVYFNAIGKKNEVIATLDRHLNLLQTEKTTLLRQNEDLLLQVNSQSDPAWIQLTLMKGLGLVPEGQLKVFFFNDDER